MSLGCLLLSSCGDVFKDELNRYAEARGAVLVNPSFSKIWKNLGFLPIEFL